MAIILSFETTQRKKVSHHKKGRATLVNELVFEIFNKVKFRKKYPKTLNKVEQGEQIP